MRATKQRTVHGRWWWSRRFWTWVVVMVLAIAIGVVLGMVDPNGVG